MSRLLRSFLIVLFGMIGAILLGTAVATADEIQIPGFGITLQAPEGAADVFTDVVATLPEDQQLTVTSTVTVTETTIADPIAVIDQQIGQALPNDSKLPVIAQNVTDPVFEPVWNLLGAEAPAQETTAPSASLSQQVTATSDLFVPTHITPDAAACVESGELEMQIACAGSRTQPWLEANGVEGVPTYTVVPRYGVGAWYNLETGMPCGYISGLGIHACDGVVFYDAVGGPESSDANMTAVNVHETGHLIGETYGQIDQAGMTIDAMFGIHPEHVLPGEQSSDCFAGAYSAFGVTNGTVSLEDAEAARQLFEELGVPGEKTHGSPEERSNAYLAGYHGGSSACNAYTPTTMIYPTG